MKPLALLFILTLSSPVSAGTAYFLREEVTGMNKNCIYTYLAREYTITIRATSICPMTIKV